jgi:hypothetical protein
MRKPTRPFSQAPASLCTRTCIPIHRAARLLPRKPVLAHTLLCSVYMCVCVCVWGALRYLSVLVAQPAFYGGVDAGVHKRLVEVAYEDQPPLGPQLCRMLPL